MGFLEPAKPVPVLAYLCSFSDALCARGYISPSRAKSVKICILMYLYVSYVSVIEAALNLHYELTPLIAAGSTAGPAQP